VKSGTCPSAPCWSAIRLRWRSWTRGPEGPLKRCWWCRIDRATLSRLQALRPLFEDAKQDNAFQDRLKRTFSFPVDELSQPFGEPALFLLGRQDHVEGYRNTWKILESFPRATYAVLDEAGHVLDVEQVQLCQALMSEWLDRVEASASG